MLKEPSKVITPIATKKPVLESFADDEEDGEEFDEDEEDEDDENGITVR